MLSAIDETSMLTSLTPHEWSVRTTAQASQPLTRCKICMERGCTLPATVCEVPFTHGLGRRDGARRAASRDITGTSAMALARDMLLTPGVSVCHRGPGAPLVG
jgi:hypothetical protein